MPQGAGGSHERLPPSLRRSSSAEAARAAGIAMNFQEMSLIPTLTVAQNIFLTREARDARGMIDDTDSIRRAQAIFDMLQVQVDPTALVGLPLIRTCRMLEAAGVRVLGV